MAIDEQGPGGKVKRRTLHFFWLLDVSSSMRGQKISTLNQVMRDVLPRIEAVTSDQRVDPLMRVIRFSDKAEWHIGPEPINVPGFAWTDLQADGLTGTAQAIRLMNQHLSIEHFGGRTIPPVCVLLSDGHCTDKEREYEAAIDELNQLPVGAKAVRLSIGVGSDYGEAQLGRFITPYLVRQGHGVLDARTPAALLSHIKYVSETVSKKVSAAKRESGAADPVYIEQPDEAAELFEDELVIPEGVKDFDPHEPF